MATMDEQFQKQLTEKDELINSLKEKTKTYVAKLKEDHSNEINLLKQQQQEKLEQAKVIILKMKEESESLKAKALQDQSSIKQLETDLITSKDQGIQYLEKLEEEKRKSVTIISHLKFQLEAFQTTISKVPVLEKTIIDLKKQLQQSERESEKDWPMEKQLTELRTLRSTVTTADNPLSLDLLDNNTNNDASSSIYSPTVSPYHSSTTTDQPLLNSSPRAQEEMKQLQSALEVALTDQKAKEKEVVLLTEKVHIMDGEMKELQKQLAATGEQSQLMLSERDKMYQQKISVLETAAISQSNQHKSQLDELHSLQNQNQELMRKNMNKIEQLTQEKNVLQEQKNDLQEQLQKQQIDLTVAKNTNDTNNTNNANTLLTMEQLTKEKDMLSKKNQEMMKEMNSFKNEYESIQTENGLLKENQNKLHKNEKELLKTIETLQKENILVHQDLSLLQQQQQQKQHLEQEQRQQEQDQKKLLEKDSIAALSTHATTKGTVATTTTTTTVDINEYNRLKHEYDTLKLEYEEMKRLQTEFENEDSQLVNELEVEQFRLKNIRGSSSDSNNNTNSSSSSSSSSDNNTGNDEKLIEMNEQNEIIIHRLTQVAKEEVALLKADSDAKTTEITGLRSEMEKQTNIIHQLQSELKEAVTTATTAEAVAEEERKKRQTMMELNGVRNHTYEDQITGLKLEVENKSKGLLMMQSEMNQLTNNQSNNHQEVLEKQILQHQQVQQEVQQLKDEKTHWQSELDLKSTALHQMTEELNTLQIRLTAAEEVKKVVDSEYAIISQEKDEIVKELKTKEEIIQQLQEGRREGEENTSLQLVQTQTRVKELMHECESLQAAVATKTADTQFLRSSLNASSELASSLQNQNKSLQQELENTAGQLKAEIDQNQDRKKKLREYVTNLNNEKSQLETTVNMLQQEMSGLKEQNKKLIQSTQHIQQEKELIDMKHQKVIEQILLDKDIVQHNYEKLEFQLRSEINQLQLLVDSHSKGISEQLQEAYHQVEIANKELEGHKTKRIQARNEMIHYAATLENVSKDSENLKSLIQENITPMVYDQVSNLESLLMNIEKACNQLSNKRMVRLQTKANDYVLKRFRNSTRIINRSSIINSTTVTNDGLLADSMTDGNNNSNSNSSVRLYGNSSNNNNTNNNTTSMSMYKKGSSGSTSIGGNYAQQQSVALLAEAIEQAEVLRNELDRVRAGITLVQQSMEKLTEVVQMDTRNCCSTMCDVFSTLPFITPFLNSTNGGSVTRDRGSRGTYDPLQSPSGIHITDDDNYSASLLNTPATPNHSRRPNDSNSLYNNNSNNHSSSNNMNSMTNSSSSRSNSPRRENSINGGGNNSSNSSSNYSSTTNNPLSPLKSIVQSRQTGMTRITQQQSLTQRPEQQSGGLGLHKHSFDIATADNDHSDEVDGLAEVDL